jgi:hypothetical protein
VQVKVWLGDTMDHHYVLSRYLISRMLTVTRIPYVKVSSYCSCRACFMPATIVMLQAVKIALLVKKYFVDNNRLDITQVAAYFATPAQ